MYLILMKGGEFMAKTVAVLIKEDLNLQLQSLNKIGKYYTDLVDDYVYFFQLKNKLKADIRKQGIRYKYINGNGIEVDKPNESILNLTKINTQMLKILNDLGLQSPQIEDDSNGEDLL